MNASVICSSCPPISLDSVIRKSGHCQSSSFPCHNCSSSISGKNPTSFSRRAQQSPESAPFLEKFKANKGFNQAQILSEDGDWNKQQFWDFIRFLRQSSRSSEIFQVFDIWRARKKSRINYEEYVKIIMVLVEDELLEPAVAIFGEMKLNNLTVSPEIYVSLIRGFAKQGKFTESTFYLQEMEERGFKPDTEAYDGLIEAYGNYKMYDEMIHCVREMESKGCQSDYVTFNLLIREFATAGLLNKMESMYGKLTNKRLYLQGSTMTAMIEAYAKFGLLNKMERIYHLYLKSRNALDEDLIRKIAHVYVEHHMFSRLEDLGLDLSSKNGSTELAWCLRILCHAGLLSKKGMYSIVEEMDSLGIPRNTTITNILALACLKMKDFKLLKLLLSDLPSRFVKPDIVTMGILFDASVIGFDGTSVKRAWKEVGYFDKDVEMNTDSLVLAAFGKGYFLKTCEKMNTALDISSEMKRVRTYSHLIGLIRTRSKYIGKTEAD